MERVSGLPQHTAPSVSDPSVEHPSVLSDEKINKFDFSDDTDGMRPAGFAHPEDESPRRPAGRQRFQRPTRMLRRGITYGPEFAPGETPYGEAAPDTQDRGLLFVNYQASISRISEFVQSRWANRDDFQQPGDGKDPMLSQDAPEGTFGLPPGRTLTFARWVSTTGGVYAFTPSLAGFAALST